MKRVKEYVGILLGVMIVALALALFLVPANLAVGGITGLAMVIAETFPQFSLGSIMFVLNIILFAVAFLLIGPSFGAKTIFASFSLTGAMALFEVILPLSQPIVSDIYLNLIFGIVIQGIGMAIVFFKGASTGGTDIVAKIVNRFTGLAIGKALLISDLVVVVLAAGAFGIELAMYAMLGIMVNGLLIDQVIASLDGKFHVTVITDHSELVNSYILEELERGVTLYHAEGGYTAKQKKVVTTILSRQEVKKLQKMVSTIDKQAFFTQSRVNAVYGEGFSPFFAA